MKQIPAQVEKRTAAESRATRWAFLPERADGTLGRLCPASFTWEVSEGFPDQ